MGGPRHRGRKPIESKAGGQPRKQKGGLKRDRDQVKPSTEVAQAKRDLESPFPPPHDLPLISMLQLKIVAFRAFDLWT